MDKWQLWHRYNRLVKDGKAISIKCPDCGSEMLTRVVDKDDDTPFLWCFPCDIFVKPGLDLNDRIKAVVSEHYL